MKFAAMVAASIAFAGSLTAPSQSAAQRVAGRGSLGFVATTALVAVALVAIVEGFGWYDTYQSESFGDRRLETPRPEECGMARAVVQDFVEHHRAARLREVGAPDQKVELRAFAWASNGPRAGRGADWRKCPGLGRFVRRHGFERMASGEMGPTLYISRARTAQADGTARLWVTAFPPQDRRLSSYDASAQPRTWEVKIKAGQVGATLATVSWVLSDPAH